MKCTYILLVLCVIVHTTKLEKFIAILVSNNTNDLDNVGQNERINFNLVNILRANKCKKIANKCGRGIKSKIVGGFQVKDIKLYPYHAMYGKTCGAAIIDEKWAITAAHCGEKETIMVGSKFREEGTFYPIEAYFVHPLWKAQRKAHFYDYDFQLLKLRDNLVYGPKVKRIKLASYDDLKIGTFLTVTGWGHTKHNGPRAKVLKAVQVPIVKHDDCQKVRFPLFKNTLTPRMFCAGYFEGKKDACQGDSGGAAVANHRLAGLVSFGFGCATPEAYGVYANVVDVKPWIENVTGLTFD